MWRALKLETLVWAHMYDDTVRYADWNDATLSIASMISPKIEPEIVFKLAQAPESSDAVAVLEAIEWLALGFEIIDCVFPDWKFQPADFVASAACTRRWSSASRSTSRTWATSPSSSNDLAAFTVRLLKNNEMVEEGAAKNALKSPALCVGELGEALKRRGGETLQAGRSHQHRHADDVAADDRGRHLDRLALRHPAVVAHARGSRRFQTSDVRLQINLKSDF